MCYQKKFWNKGFMTEALIFTQEFMLKKVNPHRIQVRHDTRNPVSGKVMTKTGMKVEGVFFMTFHSHLICNR